MPPTDGTDWKLVVGLAVALLGAIGTLLARASGAFSARATDEEKRRAQRDTAATANASLTLESVFRLVNELQEEGDRKSKEIQRVEKICLDTKSALLVRIGELETETQRQQTEIRRLEAEVRLLKNDGGKVAS